MLNPHFRDILSAFNADSVEYLVVGAFSVAAHGIPRSTGDIDLWVRASPQNAKAVWKALVKFGAPLEELSLEDFQRADTVVQLGQPPSRVDILTSVDGVSFNDAWRAKLTLVIDGVPVNIIGKEHLIANKRATGRPQDLADVARLTSQD